MKTISADEFKTRYGQEAFKTFDTPSEGNRIFNTESAFDVFERAAEDINLSNKRYEKDPSVTNRVKAIGTTALQGGFAPIRSAVTGFLDTDKGREVTGNVVDKMTTFGDVITPDRVQDAVGEVASQVIEGYEAMSPEEQLDQRNKLSVAELLSYYSGGSALKNSVVAPTIRATENLAEAVTKSAPKSADEVLKSANVLKDKVRATVGEGSVDPQVKASVERLNDGLEPKFLQGTANRTDDIVTKYDDYLTQSKAAIDDIKTDPAIAVVGEKLGEAFQVVIRDRQAVGRVMGNELNKVGKYKVSIEKPFQDLVEELADSGLTLNPRTRQLTSFQGSKFSEPEVRMLQDFMMRMHMMGNAPTVKQIDNFIGRSVSEMDFAKGKSGVLKTTNAERIINGGLHSLRESLDPANNGISQLAKYADARKTYADLSGFVKEGSQFLGKVTQAGDFARDASLMKSAVQSILNNGKKDWLLRLESLTGYKALDDAVLALQAMKDAGDFRGLSLLQAVSESGVPVSKAGFTAKIVDQAVDVGKRVVAGKPEDQTRAFLKSLAEKKKTVDLKKADPKVAAPKGVSKSKKVTDLESKIAKNVDAQKVAIKKKDFKLVEKLKRAYAVLVAKLKKEIQWIKDNSKSQRGMIKNPWVRDEMSKKKSSNPKGRNLRTEAKQALKKHPNGDPAAREAIRMYLKGDNQITRTELATAIDSLKN